MQRFKAITLVLLLLCFPASVFSKQDETDGTILIGRDYSFILKQPNGWVISSEAAKSQGVQAVLYREGSSWKDGVAVMYARVIHKDKTQSTIGQVISNDIKDFLKLSRESKVADSQELATRDNKKAVVKEFYDGLNKNYESVAFIDEPKVVVIIALSSRDKDEFDKSFPAFKQLVGSYSFVAALVNPG